MTALTGRAAGIACLAWAAAFAGCSTATAGGATSAVHSAVHGPVRSAALHSARCAPAQLKLARTGLVPEATQQHTWVIGLRNTGAARCVLDGYPGITLLDSHRARLPYSVHRGGDQMLTSAAPMPVWLAPGGTAYFGINKNACIARSTDLATVIRVIPPGARTALTLTAAVAGPWARWSASPQ
jgi:hypothetical protein